MKEYTPIRRFYAWVGFAFLAALAIGIAFFVCWIIFNPPIAWADGPVAGVVTIELPHVKERVPVYQDAVERYVNLGITQCKPVPWDTKQYRCSRPIVKVQIP